MKIKISALLLAVLIALTACSKEPVQEESGAQSESSESISQSETQNESETEPEEPEVVFPTKLYYDAKGPQIQYIRWLWGNTLFWVEFHGEPKVNYGLQELHIMDIETGEAKAIYSAEHESLLFPTVTYTDDKVYIVFDFNPDRKLVVFDRNTWEVIEETPIGEDVPAYLSISSKGIVYTAPSQYSNEIVFYPADDPSKTYGIKLDPVTRYNNGGNPWSLSGEYFMLNNFDACGYDKYSCHAEVLGGIEEGCPTETQYDIFKADGSYVSSFKIDYANGSYNYSLDWVDGDRIFVTNIYYGENHDGSDATTKYRLLDINGNLLMETELFGKTPAFHNFTSNGVYGIKRVPELEFPEKYTLLYYLSFETGEITEVGCISNKPMQNMRVAPSGEYAYVCEAGNFPGFTVLKIE